MLTLARHEAAQGRRVLIGTYKPVADLLREALAGQPSPGVEVAHFGAIRGLDGWKDFDTVIVAGREQPPPRAVEDIARGLFGGDPEPLLLIGDYVEQLRGHRMKDGSRTAVAVQVHPDPRVQALVEQAREREIEQMVGRLRPVHRERPARVFLLTNLPTALAVDRLTTWDGVLPDKGERAVARGRGVVPLSAAELARAYPDLWRTANEVDHWRKRKGSQFPIEDSYWNVATLSVATVVAYRRPGQRRGSPHRAIVPGDVYCPDAARLDLQPVVGEVEDVRVVGTLRRPADRPAPVATAAPPPSPSPRPVEHDEAELALEEPAPELVRDHPRRWEVEAPPLEEHDPAAWMIAKVPLGERARWRDRLRRERVPSERRLLRRAASLNVASDDAAPAPPLLLPGLAPVPVAAAVAPVQVAAVPVLDVILATAGRVLLLPPLERGRALPRAAA